MKLLTSVILLSSFSLSCTGNKKENTSASESLKNKLSVGIQGAEYNLLNQLTSFKAEVSCEGTEVIELDESNNSIELYGSDLDSCNVTLAEITTSNGSFETSNGDFNISPSRTVNLASYTPGEDIDISFSVTQIENIGQKQITNTVPITNTTVLVDHSPVTDFALDSAQVVALDPFNLSLEMSLSCSDCSPSQIALVKDEGQEINFANLNQMFTDSVIAIEGNELTQAGNINFKFTDIPLLASEYETTSFIAVLRIKDSNSYRVYKLGAEPVSRVETLLSTSSYATADFETPAVSSSGKWYTSKRSNTNDTLTYNLYEVDIASGAETLLKTYTKAINDAQDATFAKIEGLVSMEIEFYQKLKLMILRIHTIFILIFTYTI